MTIEGCYFSLIFSCKPIPVATEIIIIIIPIAMAEIAIFIIGEEILLLRFLAVINLLAIKYSIFNLTKCFVCVKNTVLDTIFKDLIRFNCFRNYYYDFFINIRTIFFIRKVYKNSFLILFSLLFFLVNLFIKP